MPSAEPMGSGGDQETIRTKSMTTEQVTLYLSVTHKKYDKWVSGDEQP